MVPMQNHLVFWTGSRHCGKTTSVTKLAQKAREEGFCVCGLLAPCVCREGRLVGYDAFDLRSEKRESLSKSETGEGGPFNFIPEGLRLGNSALSMEAVRTADLIIVDEFGKLELEGKGWRRNIDTVLAFSDAVILLVVRTELIGAVRKLYADYNQQELVATEEDSIGAVIDMLKRRHQHIEVKNVQS